MLQGAGVAQQIELRFCNPTRPSVPEQPRKTYKPLERRFAFILAEIGCVEFGARAYPENPGERGQLGKILATGISRVPLAEGIGRHDGPGRQDRPRARRALAATGTDGRSWYLESSAVE